MEQDHVLAVEPGLQFLDALGVDDAGAVDAEEALRIEPRFHLVHRLAEQVRLLLQVQADVVAGGLDPVDVVGAHEEHAAAGFHDQAILLLLFGLEVLDQREEALAELAGALTIALMARVIEALLEAIAAERLQQVVEGVDLEGLQRVLVVGGDEDDHRHLVGADLLDDAEAVDGRHLDVEEYQLRRELLDGADRLHAIGALADHFDVGLLRQQSQDPFPGHRLIVHHERSDFGHATPLMSSAKSSVASRRLGLVAGTGS